MNGNFKVVATESNNYLGVTNGKVYEFKDGYTVWDDGRSSGKYKDFKGLVSCNASLHFKAVNERNDEYISIYTRKNRVVATVTNGEQKFSQSVSLNKVNGDFKKAVKMVVDRLMDKFEVDWVEKDTDLTANGFKVVKQDKYEVGDKVKVRVDLAEIKDFKNLKILSDMKNQAGKIIEITESQWYGSVHDLRYKAEKNTWYSWSNECFEGKVVEIEEATIIATQFDWSAFKSGKFAVHCDTEEKAREFLKECDAQGIKWGNGKKASDMKLGATCYCCFNSNSILEWSRKEFFMEKGREVIDYTPSKLTVKEVSRKAKVGEWVKIVNAILGGCGNNYKNGDIMQIIKIDSDDRHFGNGSGQYLFDEEYVVLEGYIPEVNEVHRPAKVGEWIKVVSSSNLSRNLYQNGDILQVKSTNESAVKFGDCTLWESIGGFEYNVLENYQPPIDSKPEEPKPSEDVKPFVKAKVGDKIKIINNSENHIPEIKIGDVHEIIRENSNCDGVWSKTNIFHDCDQEYIIIEEAQEQPKAPEIILVGDTVKVVNSGNGYITFADWFKKNEPDIGLRYSFGQSIPECNDYKVLAKHPRGVYGDMNMLYAIGKDEWSPVYLIGEKGIEKVK